MLKIHIFLSIPFKIYNFSSFNLKYKINNKYYHKPRPLLFEHQRPNLHMQKN